MAVFGRRLVGTAALASSSIACGLLPRCDAKHHLQVSDRAVDREWATSTRQKYSICKSQESTLDDYRIHKTRSPACDKEGPTNVLNAWLSSGERSTSTISDWFDSSSPRMARIASNRHKWETVYRAALKGSLDSWLRSSDATSHLALILVLDQFSRIIFDDKQKYQGHARALDVARKAVENGMDAALPPELRMWFYFPFLHSESIEDQEQCRKLFTELASQHPEISSILVSVAAHHDAVKRFGRLPERNKILGRRSTKEEKEYLKEHPTA